MLLHSSNYLFRFIRKLSIGVLALCAFSNLSAQTATAPTASQDPETIDQIWQKASSKYDSQRAGLLKDVDSAVHQGPFRPNWKSLHKYEAPEGTETPSSGFLSIGELIQSRLLAVSGIPE